MWQLYILECADQTLYTGITTDLERRIKEHNESEKGAKYTRARRPVRLCAAQSFRTRALATKEERRVKRLGRAMKLDWIKNKH